MIRSDLPDVMRLEHNTKDWWTQEEMTLKLRDEKTIAYVIEHKERIIGYFIYDLYKDRVSIKKFVVSESFKDTDVPNQIIEKMRTKLINQRKKLTFRILETDLDLQILFRRFGFIATRILVRNEKTLYKMEWYI